MTNEKGCHLYLSWKRKSRSARSLIRVPQATAGMSPAVKRENFGQRSPELVREQKNTEATVRDDQ